VRIIEGDCIEQMRQMDEASVDAIVTDPPYGLEFMGKEWDKFRMDDPGTNRHRGARAGKHGKEGGDERWGEQGRSIPSNRTTYGGGKRPHTYRCSGCGKRDQFRNPHDCEGEWKRELIDPHSAPPTMLALQEWSRIWATEALRVLKPGGHLLAFGGTRTYHRLACAIEDAGFEIRDSLIWLYGSGFPKSLDVGKAIDKAAAAEREVVGQRVYPDGNTRTMSAERKHEGWQRPWMEEDPQRGERITAPATPEAAQWEGWGTALKPGHEPIVMARKPLSGTVAQNVTEHGTGALNIDATRIGASSTGACRDGVDMGDPSRFDGLRARSSEGWVRPHHGSAADIERQHQAMDRAARMGRWPANVVLSHLPECERVGVRKVKTSDPRRADGSVNAAWGTKGIYGGASSEGMEKPRYTEDGTETVPAYDCAPGCPVAELDRQSGERGGNSGGMFRRQSGGAYNCAEDGSLATSREEFGYTDSGGASRFFYTAKASRGERNAGLEGFEVKRSSRWSSGDQSPGTFQSEYSQRLARGVCPRCETDLGWVSAVQQADTQAASATRPPRATTEPGTPPVSDSDSSTISSGNESKVQSQKASKSTTETATSKTTESKTSNSSIRSRTSDSTPPTSVTKGADGSDGAQSAESGSQQTPNTSTSQSKAGSSTDVADPAISQSSSGPSSSAGNVCPSCGEVIRGALRNAHPT
jgi:hypothetical protein